MDDSVHVHVYEREGKRDSFRVSVASLCMLTLFHFPPFRVWIPVDKEDCRIRINGNRHLIGKHANAFQPLPKP